MLNRIVLLVVFTFLTAFTAQSQTRVPTIDDLLNVKSLGGARISPDGNWVTFTAYTDVANKDEESCEIFIMDLNGSNLRQMTDNNYCDYQPRWGL